MPRLFFTSCYAAMEQKITLSDYNIIPVGAQFFAPIRGVQGAKPYKRGRKGVQGAKSPAGVWGTLSGGQCEGAPVSPSPLPPPQAARNRLSPRIWAKPPAGVWGVPRIT